jgi:hypothetical protein
MNQDLLPDQWKRRRGERKSRMAAVELIATLATGGAAWVAAHYQVAVHPIERSAAGSAEERSSL